MKRRSGATFRIWSAVDRVRAIRADLARGRMPDDGELTRLFAPAAAGVAFNLAVGR